MQPIILGKPCFPLCTWPTHYQGEGWIRLIVGFHSLMVISPTASWIRLCMQVYAWWFNVDLSCLGRTIFDQTIFGCQATDSQCIIEMGQVPSSETCLLIATNNKANLPIKSERLAYCFFLYFQQMRQPNAIILYCIPPQRTLTYSHRTFSYLCVTAPA